MTSDKTLDEKLKKLRRPFTANQMETRSEVWCDLCNAEDKVCPHIVGICIECGERLPVAHDHITHVPIEALRDRFNEVDPGWGWAPLGQAPQGYPATVTHGRFEALWITLRICGISHTGVGQAIGHDDRKFGPAGLKSLAIMNTALDFGCGLQARKKQSEQRANNSIQEIHPETATNPNMPDLPEGGAINRSTHDALVASMGIDLKDLRGWLKAHHADLKLSPTGRMVGPNLMRIESQTGATPAEIRAAIDADRPLDLDVDQPDVDEEDTAAAAVTDLMADLERSVAEAKAARDKG